MVVVKFITGYYKCATFYHLNFFPHSYLPQLPSSVASFIIS
jgi:hypothetical protein